jgi:hypothetical protein
MIMKNIFKTVLCLVMLMIATISAHAANFPSQVLSDTYAQTPLTPQCSNPSFEQGFSDWTGFRAKHMPGLPYEAHLASHPPLASLVCTTTATTGNGGFGKTCHVVESSGTDVNLPSVSHPRTQAGGSSLRLGGTEFSPNTSNGVAVDGVSKRFIVQASNAIYNFRYSSVMHRYHDSTTAFTGDEPFFEAIAIDPTTGAIIDKITQPASGFNASMVPSPDPTPGGGAPIVYSLWKCAQLDLSNYVGKEVIIFFVNGDCVHGGHTAYTYVDDTCTKCDKLEDVGIKIDEKPTELKICEADKKTQVTGKFDIPSALVTSNVKITLQIKQSGSVIKTLTNGVITGNSYSFDVAVADLGSIGCYDVVAILEYDVKTAAGNIVHVKKETSAEGMKPGKDNDICLVDCPPPTPSCLNGKAEVTCGKVHGTYNIILKPSSAGGIMPTSVSITSLTPGVTLSPSKPSYPVIGGQVIVTVAGATPGQVLNFDVTGSTAGGGSVDGTNLCCSGKITVTIPKDLNCPPPPTEVDVKKYCDPVVADKGDLKAPTYSSMCHIKVTTKGVINNPINITEVLSGTGSASYVGSADPWACTPASVPANSPMNCTLAGGVMTSPADTSIIDVKVTFPNKDAAKQAKNCAIVKYEGQEPKRSCTPFWTDSHSKTENNKQCGPLQTSPTGALVTRCKITVKTNGPVTYPLNVTEALTGSGVVGFYSSSPASVWTCSPFNVTAPAPINCVANGGLNNTASTSEFEFDVAFPSAAAANKSENCGKVKSPAQTEIKSCVKFPVGSTIKINKVCEPVTEVIGAINGFQAKCHITFSTTGPQSGTIVVSEAMTNGTVLSATAPAPWNCTTANCNVNGGALNQTSSTTVIDVVVNIAQGQEKARNCARLSQSNASPIESCADIVVKPKNPDLEIVKTGLDQCKPNTPCPFTISITSIGQPYNGNVLLADVLTPNLSWPVTSITPNVCGSAISTMPFSCVANLNLAANVPFTFTVTLSPLTVNALAQNENCITAAFVGSNVPVGPISVADIQQLKNTGQLSSPKQSCWKFKVEPPVVDNKFYVKKLVVNNTPKSAAGIHFEIGDQCTGSTQNPGFAYFDEGETVLFHNYEAGMTCTFFERIPPTNLCGKGQKDVWTTSYSPAQTVTLNPNGSTLTVTNTVNCEKIETGWIDITKKFDDQSTKGIGNPSFDISYDCGQGPNTVSVYSGESSHVGPLPIGTNCTVTELAINKSAQESAELACGQGVTPVWTTTYLPSQTGIVGKDPSVTVVNTLTCKGQDMAPVNITKRVVAPVDAQVSGMAFTIGYNCGHGQQFTNPLTDGQSAQTQGSAVGVNCHFQETPFAGSACGAGQTSNWTTTYAPSQDVLAVAGASVIVTNTLTCEPNVPPVETTGQLSIKKVRTGVGSGMDDGAQYSITATCTGNPVPTITQQLVDGETKTFQTYTPGTSCTVDEDFLVPSGLCGPAVPQWTTNIVPSTPITNFANGALVTVYNRLDCFCLPGKQFSKGTCVAQQPDCKAPMVLNTKTNTCYLPLPDCRPGTHLEGRKCVENPVRCKPPALRNPETNTCYTPRPKCFAPKVYSAATNSCILVRPKCGPNEVYNAKRNICQPKKIVCQRGTHLEGQKCVRDKEKEQQCQRGTINIKGRCIAIPRCRFPEIPVPGTGLCINPFGGGGGDNQPKDGGVDVPRQIP